jgi:hypothetical protein
VSGLVSSLYGGGLSIGDYTVATLPSAALYPKMLAWVTDLHDGLPDYVMSDGTRWKETNDDSAAVIANANVNVSLSPLVNCNTQIFQGILTAGRTCTLSTTGAYPGHGFTIKREATGLFNHVVNGIALGASSWADFIFNGTSYVEVRSGGLL